MNSREIEILISKYYEGETTLEEEKVLREYFLKGDIPPHLAEHAGIFLFQNEESEQTVSDGFEEELFQKLENRVPVVSINKKRLYSFLSVAAGLLILAGLFFTFRDISQERKNERNARIAYEQTQNALLLLSVNFNSGFDKVQKLQTFDKGIKQIQQFSKFSKYQILNINQDKKSPQTTLQ